MTQLEQAGAPNHHQINCADLIKESYEFPMKQVVTVVKCLVRTCACERAGLGGDLKPVQMFCKAAKNRSPLVAMVALSLTRFSSSISLEGLWSKHLLCERMTEALRLAHPATHIKLSWRTEVCEVLATILGDGSVSEPPKRRRLASVDSVHQQTQDLMLWYVSNETNDKNATGNEASNLGETPHGLNPAPATSPAAPWRDGTALEASERHVNLVVHCMTVFSLTHCQYNINFRLDGTCKDLKDTIYRLAGIPTSADVTLTHGNVTLVDIFQLCCYPVRNGSQITVRDRNNGTSGAGTPPQT